ncbi:putative TPR repeat domain protein [Halomicronema hongdechloris C2206]|uniref:TPR repeat domain protein n=1 Tax=Halomicronema hongdechloris C2206 TaxID=1641165 RepID=A0A1Z3HLV6_9CYAN|nr:tetratricopeptide repeat protein [Halomicronema hongdechloris]ASC71302.1 putative TPR repeat domain protein [Halomicronema hongdechloris C2206]
MKQRSWLDFTEYVLLLGSGAGAITSVALQNVFYASAPLTLLVAVGLFNRRRFQHHAEQTEEALTALKQEQIGQWQNLQGQLWALPTAESLTQFQRSIRERSDRNFVRLCRDLESLRLHLYEHLDTLKEPDLSQLYQDMGQLQDQYTYLCSSVNTLNHQIQRFATTTRMEAAEADIAQLKTEAMRMGVNWDTLGRETRTTLTQLREAVQHLERQMRQIPQTPDAPMMRQELQELTRAVADRVPRRQAADLFKRLEELARQYEGLRQRLDWLQVAPTAVPESTMVAEQVKNTTAAELTALQQRLDSLESQWPQVAQLSNRLDLTELNMVAVERQLQQSLGGIDPTGHGGSPWIVEFATAAEELTSTMAGRRVLEQALSQTQQRLLVICPWSRAEDVDESLVQRFQHVLNRACTLEIGWCHPRDRQQGYLLRSISQRWGIESGRLKLLKTVLNRLLPLKQAYPERFKFKVLGTQEGFLVCDRTFAILGLQPLQTQSTAVATVDLKLRTSDPVVIDRLIQRFETPTIDPQDATAYFNRGTTRYDLRDVAGAIADLSQVLQLMPGDAIAYNDRGVAHWEQGQPQAAMADFNQALRHHPTLVTSRCNRGWLRLEQGQYTTAIDDFTVAIDQAPDTALAYFYRGSALQKLDDLAAALPDFSTAIALATDNPWPYCYRGAIYQRQGQYDQAIADLEQANYWLAQQGDDTTRQALKHTLAYLRQARHITSSCA